MVEQNLAWDSRSRDFVTPLITASEGIAVGVSMRASAITGNAVGVFVGAPPWWTPQAACSLAWANLPGLAQAYDITFSPSSPYGIDSTIYLKDRHVGAVDDTHALLWFVQKRFDLELSVTDAFAERHEVHEECGCAVEIQFESNEFRRGLRRVRQTRVAIERDLCSYHEDRGEEDEWGGMFGGVLFAVPHSEDSRFTVTDNWGLTKKSGDIKIVDETLGAAES